MQTRWIAASLFLFAACPKPSGPNEPAAGKASYRATADACRFTQAPLLPEQDECDWYVQQVIKPTYGEPTCEKEEVVTSAEGQVEGGGSKITQLVNVGKHQLALYQYAQWHEEGGSTTHVFAVVRDIPSKQLYYYPLGTAENPGVGYMGGDFSAKAEAKALIPGGVEEVVFTLSEDFHDGDYSNNSTEGQKREGQAVLWLGPEPVWVGAVSTEIEDYTGPMIEEDGAPPYKGVRRAVTVSWSTTGAEIGAVAGVPAPEKTGSFAYGALPHQCPAQIRDPQYQH